MASRSQAAPSPCRLAWPAFTVSVPTTADTIDEANETYTLTVGAASGTGTITDDDAPPTITGIEPGGPGAGDDAVVEGSNLVYNVTLSNASSVATTFAFSLGGGTAGASDFTNAPVFSNGVTLAGGLITVPAGVTSFSVTVPTIDDVLAEPGPNETLPLTIGGVTATGAIIDNEGAPTVATVSSDAQLEGTALVHTVTLSGVSAVATSYSLSLADVTATGGGVDYTSTLTNAAFSDGVTISGGTITVPAGVASFTVSVPTTLDTINEANETYTLTVGAASGTGTITDDDAPPTITTVEPGAPGAGDDAVVEGTSLVYSVTLSNASSVATTFAFSLGGGSASSSDFTNAPTFSNGVTLVGGIITVPAGVTSFTVSHPCPPSTKC